MVPFIDLKRTEDGFRARTIEKFVQLATSAQFIGGEEVDALESRLADSLDVGFAVTCANGTDALQLALRACCIGPGETVLVPNVTFWATFEAVVNVGATPITIDANLADGGVDIEAFTEALDVCRPRAAIIAHLYGWGSANLYEIRQVCHARGVFLIEDGAQAFGTSYMGESIFKGAQVSTTSFYPAKVLGAAGDGGAVFSNDSQIAQRVRLLANHGRLTHYAHSAVGWNSRLDSIQAAYLNISLDFISKRLASRRQAADFYRRELSAIGIDVMHQPAGFIENGYCNVCLIREIPLRVHIETHLRTRGIGFGRIYPGVMSQQDGAKIYSSRHFGGRSGEILCNSVLNLPLFPYITTDEQRLVMDNLQAAMEQYHER